MERMVFGILLSLGLALLTFLLRVAPRLRHRNWGVDSWWYLLYADEFRQHRQFPVRFPYYLMDIDEQWYPPLFPLMLSLFPKDWLERNHWLINPIIDFVHVFVLCFACFSATNNLAATALTGAVYAITPILVLEGTNLNSRGLGSLFLTLTMIGFLGFMRTSSPFFLALTLGGGIAVLCTHKMTTQELAVLLVGFSFYFPSWMPLALGVAMVIGALIVTRGFYVQILKGHWDILVFWNKYTDLLNAHQFYESGLYAPDQGELTPRRVFRPGWQGILHLLTMIIGFSPFALVAIFAVFDPYPQKSFLMNALLAWMILTYGLIFATTFIKPLRLFGEGFKYTRYGVFPMALFIALVTTNSPQSPIWIAATLLIVLACSVAVLQIYRRIGRAQGLIDADAMEMVERLKDSTVERVLTIPLGFSDAVAYFARKTVLWGGHSGGFGQLEGFYPVVSNPIPYFLVKYGITHVLLDQKYAAADRLGLGGFPKIMERGQYILFRVPADLKFG